MKVKISLSAGLLDPGDSGLISVMGERDSVRRISQSVEHRNGSPNVPDSSHGTTANFSHPLAFGGPE